MCFVGVQQQHRKSHSQHRIYAMDFLKKRPHFGRKSEPREGEFGGSKVIKISKNEYWLPSLKLLISAKSAN